MTHRNKVQTCVQLRKRRWGVNISPIFPNSHRFKMRQRYLRLPVIFSLTFHQTAINNLLTVGLLESDTTQCRVSHSLHHNVKQPIPERQMINAASRQVSVPTTFESVDQSKDQMSKAVNIK